MGKAEDGAVSTGPGGNPGFGAGLGGRPTRSGWSMALRFGLFIMAGPLPGPSAADSGDPLVKGNFKTLRRSLLIVKPGHRPPGHPSAKALFDGPEGALFIRGDKGAGIARGAGPAGSADPVHIIFGHMGHIKVADQSKVLHIDPPGGDVRGHQDTKPAFFETGQGLGPLTLSCGCRVSGRRTPRVFRESQPAG